MPIDSTMPIAPPSTPTSSHSTTCCQKTCARLAPSARRTETSGMRARNLPSRRPTRFSEQTIRKSSETTLIAVTCGGIIANSSAIRASGVT